MVRYAVFALPLGLVLVAEPAGAAEYYVAPMGGSDSGACSMAAPCATVEGGQTKAAAGDTVWIRGGTYSFSSTSRTVGVGFTKAGATNNPIKYFAYQSEIPVFDFTNMLPNARVTGFDVNTSWIHIRGIEVRYVQQIVTGDSWGIRIRGNNNVIEHMNVHHNEAPGIFITSGANNRILNCDSHDNYDPLEVGGNADGFGCHSTGAGNVISGCRGYSNSDDGYDFINAPGACTVEKSWAFLNGRDQGNGAGFKAGGFGSPPTNVPNPVPRHVVRQCISFGNRSQGFYANHHPGGLDFLNNVAFRNGANYNMLTDTTSDHKVQNNIALLGGGTITQMVGGTQTYNSWSITGVTAAADDFMSMVESEATAPRQADGSLPNNNFMHLAAGSDLIDKGTNVGLPFSGTAPDLGPFEVGLTAGTGGMGGAGGAAGGAPGGTAGTGTGGTVAGAAGMTPMGGAGGDGAGTGPGGVAGVGAGGSAPLGGTGGAATTGGTGVGGAATGGVTTAGSSSGGTPAAGGASSGSPGTPASDEGSEPAGCGCRVTSRDTSGTHALLAALLAFAAFARRSRRAASRFSS